MENIGTVLVEIEALREKKNDAVKRQSYEEACKLREEEYGLYKRLHAIDQFHPYLAFDNWAKEQLFGKTLDEVKQANI